MNVSDRIGDGSVDARMRTEAARSRSDSDSELALCTEALRDARTPREIAATFVNRAIVHEARGELAAALIDLDEALARAPDVARAYADHRAAAEEMPSWDLPRLELERFRVIA